MRDLGTLGGAESHATCINNKGQVVGWSHTGRLYQNGRFVGTVAAVGPPSFHSFPGSDEPKHAFLWDVCGMQDLAPRLGEREDDWCEATHINDTGQIVGRKGIGSEQEFRGFLLQTNGRIQELGQIWPMLNNRGEIAGNLAGRIEGPVLWHADKGLQRLETFDEELRGSLAAESGGTSFGGVNDKGQAVIGADNGRGEACLSVGIWCRNEGDSHAAMRARWLSLGPRTQNPQLTAYLHHAAPAQPWPLASTTKGRSWESTESLARLTLRPLLCFLVPLSTTMAWRLTLIA